jgi:hypothetical protein
VNFHIKEIIQDIVIRMIKGQEYSILIMVMKLIKQLPITLKQFHQENIGVSQQLFKKDIYSYLENLMKLI